MGQVPHLQSVIAGEGPQRKALEQLAESLNLANVKFVGQVSSAERDALIVQSHFTVLPSHAYETLGKTILGSYAFGRPVVASDIGSRRELVRHGETGLLYRNGDVGALAHAIRWLAVTPEAAERMGVEGREWVRRRHSPDAYYQTLLPLYERLIKEKTKAATVVPEVPVSTNSQLRIAFIGGRGVMSKYSGIETYYEEVGKQLALRGHSVTVYCRNHFTPAMAEHNGMELVRLPTIRSKHL